MTSNLKYLIDYVYYMHRPNVKTKYKFIAVFCWRRATVTIWSKVSS